MSTTINPHFDSSAKISLNQFHSIWDKWILTDEVLKDKFDLENSPEFEENIKNLSIKEYKYILFLFFKKKRFELNKKLMELGLKSRMEVEQEDNYNMQINGCFN